MKKLFLSIPVAALFAIPAHDTLAEDDITEGEGINLDELMEENESGEIGPGYNEEVSVNSNPGNGPDGGGYHSVNWHGDTHTSVYDHYELTHRASAGNSRSNVRSAWERQGTTARATIISTLTGNTANWATR
ncbi:hypothetical protein [Salsuginibacillus kocurii]|uniref:hypothetical protein n=1 Tax=Salsuginibacillus kocurii TaxID=427078 RepID=UPI00037C9E3D|nr:hypothetical protein [Salsuginibacillus kocurii]